MMYTVDRPFRLDQGDVSFDAPASVKDALVKGVARQPHALRADDRHSAAARAARREDADEERDSDRQRRRSDGHDAAASTACSPSARACSSRATKCSCRIPSGRRRMGNVSCAHAVPVPYPLHESLGWRPDRRRDAPPRHAEDAAIYVNSPNNPTGGVLTRAGPRGDRRRSPKSAISGCSPTRPTKTSSSTGEHISIASLPGMYERTIPLYTFSKTYAITGLRLGYIAVHDPTIRDRMRKMLFYTVSNTSSLIQYGGLGALEGSQAVVEDFQRRAGGAARSVLRGHRDAAHGMLTRRAAGRRVLRVPEDRSGVEVAAARRAGVAVVGDDGIPDQARPHRLRPRRRLRLGRRRPRAASASRATAKN